MDSMREMRLLYEAFYHFKNDVTLKLDALEKAIHRQESMYELIRNIETKLSTFIPNVDEVPELPLLTDEFHESLPEDINSAPPAVQHNNHSTQQHSRMFGSDTNLSYMKRRTRDSTPNCRRNIAVKSEVNINRSSSEEEVCLPSKVKNDVLLEFESKQDSGLESGQRSDSSLLLEDDPLARLLDEIEHRVILNKKQNIISQISDSDRYLGLVHERSKMAYQSDLLQERLRNTMLERDSYVLRVKEMKKNINSLEADKQWLVERLEENIANKKQVQGKIGGMHNQFVKKNRTPKQPKLEEPSRRKRLTDELRLKDIVEETDVVELRRKLIKSIVKNYALQSKLETSPAYNLEIEQEDRSRVKNGTYTKVKRTPVEAKSRIPTMSRSKSENNNETPTRPECNCKTLVKTVKDGSDLFLIQEANDETARKRLSTEFKETAR